MTVGPPPHPAPGSPPAGGYPSAPLASPPQAPGVIDELIVPYAYVRMSQIVTRYKRVVTMRIVSLCITAVILIALQLWRHFGDLGSPIFGWPYWAALGVSLAIGLAFLAYAFWQWRRARAQAAMMQASPALVIARQGVELQGRRAVWDQVAGLQARTLRLRGDQFAVHLTSGASWTIPFHLLDVAPSSLDSAARAFSGDRIGVDFAKMDN